MCVLKLKRESISIHRHKRYKDMSQQKQARLIASILFSWYYRKFDLK